MYSDWTAAAQRAIKAVTATMIVETPLIRRVHALREAAWEFHGGTSWGKRVWGRECRKYLEMHGQPKRVKAKEPVCAWPDHVSFPFKSANPIAPNRAVNYLELAETLAKAQAKWLPTFKAEPFPGYAIGMSKRTLQSLIDADLVTMYRPLSGFGLIRYSLSDRGQGVL